MPLVVGTILLEKLFDFLAIGVMLLLLVVHDAAADGGAGRRRRRWRSSSWSASRFVVALAIWRAPTLRVVGMVETLIPFGVGRRVGLRDAGGGSSPRAPTRCACRGCGSRCCAGPR